ncbi:MAG: tetratricopeptide repeat protein [Steroidobacteraceae bacterium]
MPYLSCRHFPILLLLLAATAAAAQVPSGQTAAGGTTPAPAILKPGVTVTGKPLHPEPPLPKLPPGEFTNCEHMLGAGGNPDRWQVEECEVKLALEKNTVLDDCFDLKGKIAPQKVIQACTEALDDNILEVPERSFVFVGRADAYFALGDRQRALDDYNAAIKSAPRNAALYYNRGVVFIAQANYAAALQDFDTALKFDPRFVPALRQRAKIHAARDNLPGALADYSAAIRLQPGTAALWSRRGQVDLDRHEYGSP